MRPWSATATRTGDIWGVPSARVVASTARWCVRAKSRARSRSTSEPGGEDAGRLRPPGQPAAVVQQQEDRHGQTVAGACRVPLSGTVASGRSYARLMSTERGSARDTEMLGSVRNAARVLRAFA